MDNCLLAVDFLFLGVIDNTDIGVEDRLVISDSARLLSGNELLLPLEIEGEGKEGETEQTHLH